MLSSPQVWIGVQTERFDSATLEQLLPVNAECGAIASFIGRVRNHGDRPDVVALRLEHYPAMTERVLAQHAAQAAARFGLHAVVLLHRVGELALGEPIVGVAVASAHRQATFDALQYLMDVLKHDAPFWKQEITQAGEAYWVDQKQTDQQRFKQW